jgi:hypothetical protein
MEFNKLKNEILRRAKEARACTAEYQRAYQSNDCVELMQVIKDNFHFAVNNKVIDPSLIESCKDQFNANGIYCNVDVSDGFLLASGNATVRAWGNATVRAWGSATVEASGNATVEASGNATVRALDNATVEASGNATVRALDNATVRASDNATVRASDNATVEAWGNATVEAWDSATVRAGDNATVEAWDNAYVTSYHTIECKLRDNAIYRIRESNTVRYVSDEIKFEKVPAYEPKENDNNQ